MQRHYGRLVVSLTVTVATFFGAGVIVAMLYVGPQITAPGRVNPLVVHDYSFTDVVLMGIIFGLMSAILCLAVLIPITRLDKRRCTALSKSLNVPLAQVFFLTQSCVVRKSWATRQDAFDESLAALRSLRVWVKIQDARIGCIEAYSRPLFASRVTVKIDEVDGNWQVTAVSTPVSGLMILDFGRNFELVNQFRQALASD